MLACIIAYTDRVNIAVALLGMQEQFGWSQTDKGLILSAFFVGYLLFMLVAGMLAARYGGKRVLGCSVAAWSFLTLLTPLAARTSLSALIAVRIGLGLAEAGLLPAAYELYGRWVPPVERARMVALLLSGVPIGTVIGLAGSGWLVHDYGWPAAFYAFGAAGLLWLPLWFGQVENDPRADRRLRASERALLPAAPRADSAARRVPLCRLLLRPPVLAIIIGQFASLWNLYILLSWLPSYFRDAQGQNIPAAGLYSAAPWLAMLAATNIAAAVSERLIARGFRVTAVRKLMQCGGLGLCAACLFATRAADSPAAALALICLATAALGCTWCGYSPAFLDVAPHDSALLVAVGNTIGTLPGIVGVALTGWLLDATGSYTAAFALTASIGLGGALLFGVFFDARPCRD
jgi:ACS family sodium-dependent inorganic phosphate cotransporter